MRTAPTGPSNGMPDSIRAAEAPFRASTSWGFSMSAPRTVPTMWTSLRKPCGNIGRSGRSMRRQVRTADSGALPSRRKNEPGILPAAYIRSSMSTVSGKKSAPGRGDFAPVAVTRTVERPIWARTAPPARPAMRPVSNDIVLSVPLNVQETVVASVMLLSSRSPPGTTPDGSTAAICGVSGMRTRVAHPHSSIWLSVPLVRSPTRHGRPSSRPVSDTTYLRSPNLAMTAR